MMIEQVRQQHTVFVTTNRLRRPTVTASPETLMENEDSVEGQPDAAELPVEDRVITPRLPRRADPSDPLRGSYR
jgi:hypothetical protein